MKRKNLFIVLMCILFVGLQPASGTALVLKFTDGQMQSFMFSRKPVITFEGKMLVVTSGVSTVKYNRAEIADFHFADTAQGDVNGDGKIDLADVTAVTDIINGSEAYTKAADANGDGRVDIGDIITILNTIESTNK